MQKNNGCKNRPSLLIGGTQLSLFEPGSERTCFFLAFGAVARAGDFGGLAPGRHGTVVIPLLAHSNSRQSLHFGRPFLVFVRNAQSSQDVVPATL